MAVILFAATIRNPPRCLRAQLDATETLRSAMIAHLPHSWVAGRDETGQPIRGPHPGFAVVGRRRIELRTPRTKPRRAIQSPVPIMLAERGPTVSECNWRPAPLVSTMMPHDSTIMPLGELAIMLGCEPARLRMLCEVSNVPLIMDRRGSTRGIRFSDMRRLAQHA